jgi:hypothetical protein
MTKLFVKISEDARAAFPRRQQPCQQPVGQPRRVLPYARLTIVVESKGLP